MLKVCPESMRPHAELVLRGEYALPPGYELTDTESLVVLDIGANVGAFSLWARKTWPGCRVIAYEPVPENFDAYCKNVTDCNAVCAAVGSDDTEATMYLGKNNCGECSMYDLGEQSGTKVRVKVVDARRLPAANVLKVDTEGHELDVIGGYLSQDTHRPEVVMLEWHRATDRWWLGGMLTKHGYDCVRDEVRRKDRGIMAWVRG